MTGPIVHRPIWTPDEPVNSALVVLDAGRRLYAGLNRAGDAWHVIQPSKPNDPRVGDGHVQAGCLVCTCEAGIFGRRCYRIEQAEAFEGARVTSTDLAGIFAS